MVCGKYSALSGAVAREQALDNLSSNLANVNTSGYKKNKIGFESLLRGARQTSTANGINYSRIRTIDTDFTQGGMQETGKSLDVAVNGEGFFKIKHGNDIFYTRDGHFHLDDDGMLKTTDGFNVLGDGDQPLQIIMTDGGTIDINETGGISLDGETTGESLQVFTVADKQQLVPKGYNRFQLEPGATALPSDDSTIIQGSVETSNVNMMEEMAIMINTQRKFESYIQALESYSTISEKQEELGSIGN